MDGRAPAPRVQLSPARVAGRARFAGILRAVVEAGHHAGCSLVPAWAARLVVSEQHVRRWLDCTVVTAPMACGDLDALDDESFEDVVARWREDRARRAGRLTARRARDPVDEVNLIMCELGRAAQAAHVAKADGRVTPAEWGHVAATLDAIEAKVREARRAVRAAREAAP